MICLKKKCVVTQSKGVSNEWIGRLRLKLAPSSSNKEVKRMNKMTTSMIAFGVGMAAYNLAQRNNMMSMSNMKKMQRKVKRALS